MKPLNIFIIAILLFSFTACKKESSKTVNEPAWLKQDLLVYYPMDGNTKDSSGNNLDGVPVGLIPTTNRKNESNKAMSFFNGYMLNNVNNSHFENDFTLSLWAQLDSFQTPNSLLIHSTFLGLQLNSNQFLFLFYRVAPVYSGFLDLKRWNNITIVRQADSSRIFFNGTNVRSFENIIPRQQTYAGNSMAFGRELNGYNPQLHNFKGKFDDIRIYKRALTAEEVKYLYQN
jgi:hypothetical protein